MNFFLLYLKKKKVCIEKDNNNNRDLTSDPIFLNATLFELWNINCHNSIDQ